MVVKNRIADALVRPPLPADIFRDSRAAEEFQGAVTEADTQHPKTPPGQLARLLVSGTTGDASR